MRLFAAIWSDNKTTVAHCCLLCARSIKQAREILKYGVRTHGAAEDMVPIIQPVEHEDKEKKIRDDVIEFLANEPQAGYFRSNDDFTSTKLVVNRRFVVYRTRKQKLATILGE